MVAQNSITNAEERRIVVRQIRRANARIKSYKDLAKELGVDIGPNQRCQANTEDTNGLTHAVNGWVRLVQAYDFVQAMLKSGISSLTELSLFVANLMVTRGYGQVDLDLFDRAQKGALELKSAQRLLEKYGFELTSLTLRQLSPEELEQKNSSYSSSFFKKENRSEKFG